MAGGDGGRRRVKERVMALLARDDRSALHALLEERPAAVRHLVGRLWDADPTVREAAAEVLGAAAGRDPALGLELLRRFDWALNDESATNAGAVLAAMGAIAVRLPEVAAPFAGRIVAALDDPALAEAARRVLGRIEREAPELLRSIEKNSSDERPVPGEVRTGEGGDRWPEG